MIDPEDAMVWILSAYYLIASIFYVVQIILIVILLECEVDPCPDKSRL